MSGLVMLLACAGGSPVDHAQSVSALEGTFPTFSAYGVTTIRGQDWCEVLQYRRGTFASTSQPNCIYILESPHASFDAQAQADLALMLQHLERTGTGANLVTELQYDDSGGLVYGRFDVSSDMRRQVYVYNPGYTLPEDVDRERWHTAINLDWYLVISDWN